MQFLYKSRYALIATIILLYLLPIVLLSSYGRLYMPAQKGWNLLSFGIFCSSFGSLLLFWLFYRWEQGIHDSIADEEEEPEITLKQTPLPEPVVIVDESLKKAFDELEKSYTENLMQTSSLQNELQIKNDELQKLQHECHQLHQQVENFGVEKDDYQKSIQYELEKQKKLLTDSQKTIAEQREGIDKKLQQIAHLESKVSDLTYEIKTLIQLAEIENQSMAPLTMHPGMPPLDIASNHLTNFDLDDDIPCLPEKKVKNAVQGSIQLKRCIDIAQKITGASHYNNSNSRFKDLTVDNYTLDLRRLFESLRMENACAIVFYSQKENKILFVNNQSRALFGWSPDKFVQSFNDIIELGKDTWKHGISSLSIKNEAHVNLKIKSKSGQLVETQALLGIIPTGIFRHHIIGVLYIPSNETSFVAA